MDTSKEECKHSWIQESPIKVCFYCGFKPEISTSKDIRERVKEAADNNMVAGVGGEFISDEGIDSIINIFKEYIEEKSSKSKMIGRLAFTQELLEGLEKENGK